MKSKLFAPSTTSTPAELELLKLELKPVDGITFRDSGIGTGRPAPDALERLEALRRKYLGRKLRKGEKGAAQLMKEARESLDRR